MLRSQGGFKLKILQLQPHQTRAPLFVRSQIAREISPVKSLACSRAVQPSGAIVFYEKRIKVHKIVKSPVPRTGRRTLSFDDIKSSQFALAGSTFSFVNIAACAYLSFPISILSTRHSLVNSNVIILSRYGQ